MSALRKALQEYLALRRGLGFKMRDAGLVLPRFVAFMEVRQALHITTRLALEWVQQAKTVQPPIRSPMFRRRSSCHIHRPELGPTCTPSRKCRPCWKRRCNCRPRGRRPRCGPGSFIAFWGCSASRACASPKRST